MKYEYLTKCMNCGSSVFDHFIDTMAHMHNVSEKFSFMKCTSCKLVFLNPRVKQEEISEYYQDYYLPYRGPGAWGRFAGLVQRDLDKTDSKRVKRILEGKKINNNTRVVDVGCGKPSFLKKLHDRTGCVAIGTDFIDSGWKEDPGKWEGLQLIQKDIRGIEFEEKIDLITMWHYLEHDYDPGETLKHLRKYVKRDSLLIIEVPNLNSLTRKLQGAYWEGFHSPRHTAIYTVETLRSLLQNYGWEVVSSTHHGTLNPYALFWMGQQERKRIDWSMKMEKKLPSFILGMILTSPVFVLQKYLPLAVLTVTAKPAS